MFEQKITPPSSDSETPSFADDRTPSSRVEELASALADLTSAERLVHIRRVIDGRIVFTHGFGVEGQLLYHWICEHDLDIDVVTLDTGRLFPETYKLWSETERRYGRRIQAIYPAHAALESLVKRYGVDGFYESKQARVACCTARKTKPLERALAGASAWIAGLRADQSDARHEASVVAFDDGRGVLKVNPLVDWTRERVLAAVKANKIPINSLHAKGFGSIGCAPCTRAIAPGEPERNGRWWWEKDGARECGLHQPLKKSERRTSAQAGNAACG